MSITLFHNPKCGTSRNALKLLREQGVQPRVVEYLKTGWDRATLERLAARTGVGLPGLLRGKEDAAKALLEAGADDEAILAAAIAEPIPDRAAHCRDGQGRGDRPPVRAGARRPLVPVRTAVAAGAGLAAFAAPAD